MWLQLVETQQSAQGQGKKRKLATQINVVSFKIFFTILGGEVTGGNCKKHLILLLGASLCNLKGGTLCSKFDGFWQGLAGKTFEGSGTGTGIENSIPKVWEREGN